MKKTVVLSILSIVCVTYSIVALEQPYKYGATNFGDKMRGSFNSSNRPNGFKNSSTNKTEQSTQQLPLVFEDQEIAAMIQVLTMIYTEEKNIQRKCDDITFHRFKLTGISAENKNVDIIKGCLNKECSNFIQVIIGIHGSKSALAWAHDGSQKSDQILKKLLTNNLEDLINCFTYPFAEDEFKEHAKNK